MAGARSSGKYLLVVEDDELTREVFGLILRGKGYEVHGAASGQEALDQLHDGEPPDCILLDLRMPGMDGRQFRACQVQDPALASIPVVVISAERNLSQEAATLGVADYLQKPVEADVLLAMVKRYC